MVLPVTEFDFDGKKVEAFTLEDKSNNSYEILFIDKATQKSLGSYTVQNQSFSKKGLVYDIAAFFELAVADFKRIGAA